MTDMEVIKPTDIDAILLDEATVEVVSPEQVQLDMVRRILGSDTLQEAFAGFQSTPVERVLGEVVTVYGVAWMRSAFEEGPAVYALLDCSVRDDDERVTVSMGSRTLMASFRWAQTYTAMPFKGVFRRRQSRANPEYSFLEFELID